jgi:hypothetical protein
MLQLQPFFQKRSERPPAYSAPKTIYFTCILVNLTLMGIAEDVDDLH